MTDARALGPPMSKTAYVVQRLREDIAAGVVVPGASLRQTEVADRYGVSATPVREALRLLEAEGTISYTPHRGATVRELSATHTEDVYLLRAEIEGLATAVAAERRKDEDMAGIYAIQSELEAVTRHGAGEELAILNRRLHFAIYAAGSETIAAYAANLWALFPPHVTIWRDPGAAQALLHEHEGILEAVAAQDARLARERAAAHILHAARLRRELAKDASDRR